MSRTEKFYPNESNLGKQCAFWSLTVGCRFPKGQLEGRRTCEGLVDDVCLLKKDGRPIPRMNEQQVFTIQIGVPDARLIPPGSVKP